MIGVILWTRRDSSYVASSAFVRLPIRLVSSVVLQHRRETLALEHGPEISTTTSAGFTSNGMFTRGQQRSGARTPPARARTKPACFASPSTEPSSAGSDTDSGRTPQLGNSDKATGGTVTQLPPLSADDWSTLQALIAQARGPSSGSGHCDGGGAVAAPAAAAPAPSPFPSERRPRYRARGHTSRRRASSSSPSSYASVLGHGL
nr:uncharacterized protein LOC123746998 isoform X2 [Procambarus clarkii]